MQSKDTSVSVMSSSRFKHMEYLQSAKEINPGYSNVQSYLTYTLLGVSVAGLFLTLMLLVPVKEIRSLRSVKINICLSTALLLASSLFLFQDTLINIQDTGLIKLVSLEYSQIDRSELSRK